MFFFPGYTEKQFAGYLYPQLITEIPNAFSSEIIIESYGGKNPTVRLISDFLESHSHPAITGALVHGSVGTGEEVKYSDFDGILLIDEKRIENRMALHSLIRIIRKTNAMMLHQDALQHHGWNILTVNELAQYPDDILPLVLLEKSKTIYPARKLNIQYHLQRNGLDYKKTFTQLTRSIEQKIHRELPADSFRHFKSYVSEILLLPAVCIQAATNKPVFKKESFDMIREYVQSHSLNTISKYSALRNEWSQEEANIKQERKYLRYRWAGRIANRLSAGVPERYRHWLSRDNTNEVLRLLKDLNGQFQRKDS
jgi:hypothetical protein